VAGCSELLLPIGPAAAQPHTLKKGLETFFNFEKKMANFQISIAEMGFKGKTRKRERKTEVELSSRVNRG